MPASIAAVANEVGARLERYGVDFEVALAPSGWRWERAGTVLDELPWPALPGRIQVDNAATALAALAAGGLLPSRAAIVAALGGVRLAGRFQVEGGAVEWVFDVAHNVASAEVLAGNLRGRPTAGRTWYVVGMLRDKDVFGVASALAPAAREEDAWCCVSLTGERGLPAAELAARLALRSRPAERASVEDGCRWAHERAVPGDRVVVFGSFLAVGPALEWHRVNSRPPR
jgi:dihydrofolate synthase / folylpolyglutamate synthase